VALAFAFAHPLEASVTDVLHNEAIQLYQDDPDLQNLIDWTQTVVR
jgi:hypothetical protein